MSRRMLLVVRDFALDPYRTESRFQSAANCTGEFGDSEDLCGSLEKIGDEFHKSPCDYSGERRLPACIRRQLADEIVFGKLPALPGKDGFGGTPKPARETRAPSGIIARAIIRQITHSAPRSAV